MVERRPTVKFPDPDLDILEDLEEHELYITSPKRKERIVIYRPWDKTGFWKIKYEGGNEISECSGHFTSMKLALVEVKKFLNKTKISPAKKHDDLFGPIEEKPVLRRKKVVKKIVTEPNTATG